MQEDLEKIREAKAVAEANIVPGVMNPLVSYYEVMLEQGYVVAEGMYQGKNMAIFDTYQDWRDIEITTLEAFRERQQSKQTLNIILSVIGFIALCCLMAGVI
ncbi:hypothetical protein L1C48_01520 [Klebsiella pneumoniae]|nr:hypothetical protein [Klebsiella pneumoniae]